MQNRLRHSGLGLGSALTTLSLRSWTPQAETTALIGRLSSTPSDETILIYDNTIKKLKTNGYWDKLDVLVLSGVTEESDSLLNWKSNNFNPTKVSTPTFVSGKGWTVAELKHLDTNYNPKTNGSNYTVNSASMGLFTINDEYNTPNVYRGDIGAAHNVGTWRRLGFSKANATTGFSMNNDAAIGTNLKDSKGWTIISKENDTVSIYNDDSRTLKGGVLRWNSSSVTTTDCPNLNVLLGQDMFYYGNRTFGGYFFGSKLNETDCYTIQNILWENWHLPMNNYFESICLIGDSLMSGMGVTNISELIDSTNIYKKIDLSDVSDTVADQTIAWNALNINYRKSLNKAIFILIGLNDIDGSSSTVLSAIQGLINTIRNDNSTVPINIMTLCPYRSSIYCNESKYIVWQEVNTGIMNTGIGALTGVTTRINAHTTEFDDGNGNLKAGYDNGDHVHLNLAGRTYLAGVIDSNI